VQFLSMGLLGELLIRVYHEIGKRTPYVVRATAGLPTTEDELTTTFDDLVSPSFASVVEVDPTGSPREGYARQGAASNLEPARTEAS
jgi:hypothetical protein